MSYLLNNHSDPEVLHADLRHIRSLDAVNKHDINDLLARTDGCSKSLHAKGYRFIGGITEAKEKGVTEWGGGDDDDDDEAGVSPGKCLIS
ncbi:MAG: hypothetical protein P1U63_06955 [Coxiellaceae bacterium]|nr:hypothetical protein [Coxiellaceae bacterium]